MFSISSFDKPNSILLKYNSLKAFPNFVPTYLLISLFFSNIFFIIKLVITSKFSHSNKSSERTIKIFSNNSLLRLYLLYLSQFELE